MKKKMLTLILAATIALSFTACGDLSADSAKETATETKEGSVEEPAKDMTSQSILDDYTQKSKDETPALVEEYDSDAGCCGGY